MRSGGMREKRGDRGSSNKGRKVEKWERKKGETKKSKERVGQRVVSGLGNRAPM